MGDFEQLLETVWEVPRTPLTLYLGSRTPKHSVISVFDNERVDFSTTGGGSGPSALWTNPFAVCYIIRLSIFEHILCIFVQVLCIFVYFCARLVYFCVFSCTFSMGLSIFP